MFVLRGVCPLHPPEIYTYTHKYVYTDKSLQRPTFIQIYIYILSPSSYLHESGVHMKQKL